MSTCHGVSSFQHVLMHEDLSCQVAIDPFNNNTRHESHVRLCHHPFHFGGSRRAFYTTEPKKKKLTAVGSAACRFHSVSVSTVSLPPIPQRRLTPPLAVRNESDNGPFCLPRMHGLSFNIICVHKEAGVYYVERTVKL